MLHHLHIITSLTLLFLVRAAVPPSVAPPFAAPPFAAPPFAAPPFAAPLCTLQLTTQLDTSEGADTLLATFVIANTQAADVAGWELAFTLRNDLANATLLAATGATPVSDASTPNATLSSQQPLRLADAPATAIIPPGGSTSANALLRLPGSNEPLQLSDIILNGLKCYILPQGVSRLGLSSMRAVRRLDRSTTCPRTSTDTTPCRLNLCCVPADLPPGEATPSPWVRLRSPALPTAASVAPPPRGAPGASSTGASSTGAASFSNTTPAVQSTAPAAGQSSTPSSSIAVPVAIAGSALVAVVLAAGALWFAQRRRRRHGARVRSDGVVRGGGAPAAAAPGGSVSSMSVLAPPQRLAPIVTRLLSTQTSSGASSPTSSHPGFSPPAPSHGTWATTSVVGSPPASPTSAPPHGPPQTSNSSMALRRSNTAPSGSQGLALVRRARDGAGTSLSFVEIDFDREVELLQRIGSGGFGTVYKGLWRGQAVAIKVFHPLEPLPDQEDATPAYDDTFLKEVRVLGALQHPRVVRLLGACLQPPMLAIVQDLAAGSLWELLHGSGRQRLGLGRICQIAMDVADAMAYLHPHVVHRDLKSHNVLLDKDGRALICDFGIARLKDRTYLSTTTGGPGGGAGTPAYMAPECFEAEGRISHAVDVYAFGMLLWEMLTGRVPWAELGSPMKVIYAVGVLQQRPPLPAHCPPSLALLVQRCWAHNPQERPPFVQVLSELRMLAKQEFDNVVLG